jgi:hypothetical protein
MIASALLLLMLTAPPPGNGTDQASSGIYLASVTVNVGVCSYGIMDVLGLSRSQLAGSLAGYHARDPNIGLNIWVSHGTPKRCVDGARSAAKAAGYVSVRLVRDAAN